MSSFRRDCVLRDLIDIIIIIEFDPEISVHDKYVLISDLTTYKSFLETIIFLP